MCFSKSNLISSCTVCLWPPNYQNSVATPYALTSCATDSQKQSPEWDTEEICSSFYHLFYDSSLSSGSYVLLFLLPSFLSPITPWSLPPFLVLLSFLLILHSKSASFSFHSPRLPSLYPYLPSLLPICSQSGSVRSWRDLCPLASVRQCPVGVIMMDGVISRGAFRQEGWAHHAFSQL